MPCTGHIFHPTDPCCGTPLLCRAFPDVDWSRYGWLVTVPAATLAEIRYTPHRYSGSPAVFIAPGDPDNYKFAYRTDFSYPHDRLRSEPTTPPEITTTEVFHWQNAYHCRGGRFRSRYGGGCLWSVRTRERLCPQLSPLMVVDKGDFLWLVSPNNFTPTAKEWQGYRIAHSPEADPITGPFFTYANSETSIEAFSWRDVLRAGECELLPSIQSRNLPYYAYGAIEGGLLYRLQEARDNISSEDQTLCDAYEPTAMDLAVAGFLHESLTFGVVSDPLSPLYGQYVIFQNASYSVTGTLQATAWELQGDDVLAEVGTVNRFERSNDNDTLPAWVELELVPL